MKTNLLTALLLAATCPAITLTSVKAEGLRMAHLKPASQTPMEWKLPASIV